MILLRLKWKNVLQCRSLTLICVALCLVMCKKMFFTKCHTVTHHALDQMVLSPLPSALRDVLQSDLMNVKPLYIFLCGNNEGCGSCLHFHGFFWSFTVDDSHFPLSVKLVTAEGSLWVICSLLAWWYRIFKVVLYISVTTHRHIWHKLSQCRCCYIVTYLYSWAAYSAFSKQITSETWCFVKTKLRLLNDCFAAKPI